MIACACRVACASRLQASFKARRLVEGLHVGAIVPKVRPAQLGQLAGSHQLPQRTAGRCGRCDISRHGVRGAGKQSKRAQHERAAPPFGAGGKRMSRHVAKSSVRSVDTRLLSSVRSVWSRVEFPRPSRDGRNLMSLFRWASQRASDILSLMPRQLTTREMQRALLHADSSYDGIFYSRREDHRHFLPAFLQRAQAQSPERRILHDPARGAVLRLPGLQALSAARHGRQATELGWPVAASGWKRRPHRANCRRRICAAWESIPRGRGVIFCSTMA